MAENSFSTARDKWDELPIADKTWTKWKNHSVDAQAAIECATRANSDSFVGANAVAAFHGTGTGNYVPVNDATISTSTVDNLDGYLDNLVAAATNERSVIDGLFSKN